MAINAPPPDAPASPPTAGPARRDGSTGRRIGRRRNLPAGRAVVGGLLVTVAAIGTFLAATSAGSGPEASVVVATRPIAVGEHLRPSDLRTVPAELPDDVTSTVFASTLDLEGAVALAPIDTDQAIARSTVSVASTDDARRTHDLSFALERDRALNGRIQPGEVVDLVATFGSGDDATTRVVVRGVRVAELDSATGSSGAVSAKVTITLAFDTEDDVLVAANALEVAKVTLSRSTGTAPPEPDADPRPPTEPGSTDRLGGNDGDGPAGGDGTPGTPGSTAPTPGAP